MLTLSIDTTAKTASAALLDGEKLLSLYSVNATRTHSENMLPMIEHMLQCCGVSINQIDLFACSSGPGSFTGVRIGVSLIKGLAHGLSKPCVGVNTLSALARNYTGIANDGDILCPVMDARRSQVYNAVYTYSGGQPKMTVPGRAISVDGLEAECSHIKDARIILIGDGCYLFEGRPASERFTFAPMMLRYQNAYSVGLEALALYAADKTHSYSSEELSVVYYRPSQAERNRTNKENESDEGEH